MTDEITVARGSADDLPSLAPLWIAVHHRHVEAMPELAPYVDDGASWTARERLYAELLAKPDTVLLLARASGALVGYGLAHVLPAADTWLADTWRTAARIGEVESLGVLEGHREKGIGTRLLDGLEAALAADGVEDLVLGALPGNTHALRLYEQRGYRPTWVYLSRLRSAGR